MIRTAQDAVVFENVALRYGGAGAESLSGLSFRVRRGQTVGIIGGTGSGKSSLVNLIPRFYDATDGRILVDGVDVRDYPARQLRSKIGIVPQKAVLFAGTIAENLRWGKEDATDAELQVALETSQAAEFVSDPRGRSERRGRAGRQEPFRRPAPAPDHCPCARARSQNSHSGRQRLRAGLCHGRAACARPSAPTDANVTVFLVSQRAASIQYADQIVVLDDGAVVGRARIPSCWRICEVYQEIYYSQFPEGGEERMKKGKQKGTLRQAAALSEKILAAVWRCRLLFAAVTVAHDAVSADPHRAAPSTSSSRPGQVEFSGIASLLLKMGILIGATALSQWIMNACNNRITYRTVQRHPQTRPLREDADPSPEATWTRTCLRRESSAG